MAPEPKKPRLNVFFPDEALRTEFKKLCADAQSSMSQRAIELISTDVLYWQSTGMVKPIDSTQSTEPKATKKNLDDSGKFEDLAALMHKLLDGTKPTDEEIILAAEALGVDVQRLISFCSRLGKEKSNGHA